MSVFSFWKDNGHKVMKRRDTRSIMVRLYATFYGLYIRIFRWSYMHTVAGLHNCEYERIL